MEATDRILVTMPPSLCADFFAPDQRERLESLGDVVYHDDSANMTEAELIDAISGATITITGWGSPTLTAEVMAVADDLDLLAHAAGSVATYVSPALFDAGVTVCSANRPMARFTAELTLGHMISAERHIADTHHGMREGDYDTDVSGGSLVGANVGIVGLGTVARYLLRMLEPFDVSVRVYDPYVAAAELTEYDVVEKASLDEVLSESDIVSIHAARTPETIGMIGAKELERIQDGALLVNTARAAIIDEGAVVEELERGRIRAAFDVYHDEPLPADHPLRSLENVQLTPHRGGHGPHEVFGETIVDEIERFQAGHTLQHEIPREQAELMTR